MRWRIPTQRTTKIARDKTSHGNPTTGFITSIRKNAWAVKWHGWLFYGPQALWHKAANIYVGRREVVGSGMDGRPMFPMVLSPTCTEGIPARRRRRSTPSASVAAAATNAAPPAPALPPAVSRTSPTPPRRGRPLRSCARTISHRSPPCLRRRGLRTPRLRGILLLSLILLDRLFLPPAIACRRTESVPPSALHLQFCDNPPWFQMFTNGCNPGTTH